MRTTALPRALGVGFLAASALVVRRAHAIDPFEIQVYDGTANSPGSPGLELHVNRVFSGLTTAPPPELPQNQQTHFTLEPSIGVTPFWEIGGCFKTTLHGDGTFDYAGVELRSSSSPTKEPGTLYLGSASNLEVSLPPTSYDRDRVGDGDPADHRVGRRQAALRREPDRRLPRSLRGLTTPPGRPSSPRSWPK